MQGPNPLSCKKKKPKLPTAIQKQVSFGYVAHMHHKYLSSFCNVKFVSVRSLMYVQR